MVLAHLKPSWTVIPATLVVSRFSCSFLAVPCSVAIFVFVHSMLARSGTTCRNDDGASMPCLRGVILSRARACHRKVDKLKAGRRIDKRHAVLSTSTFPEFPHAAALWKYQWELSALVSEELWKGLSTHHECPVDLLYVLLSLSSAQPRAPAKPYNSTHPQQNEKPKSTHKHKDMIGSKARAVRGLFGGSALGQSPSPSVPACIKMRWGGDSCSKAGGQIGMLQHCDSKPRQQKDRQPPTCLPR